MRVVRPPSMQQQPSVFICFPCYNLPPRRTAGILWGTRTNIIDCRRLFVALLISVYVCVTEKVRVER